MTCVSNQPCEKGRFWKTTYEPKLWSYNVRLIFSWWTILDVLDGYEMTKKGNFHLLKQIKPKFISTK